MNERQHSSRVAADRHLTLEQQKEEESKQCENKEFGCSYSYIS